MRWLRRWDRWSRRAAAGLGLAAVVAAGVLAAALHVTPPRAQGTADEAWNPLPPAPDTSSAGGDDLVRAAVDADPFREDRSPPSRRYVLPENREDRGGGRRPAGRGGLELVGTATFPDGRPGLAAFRLSNGDPRVVRSGAEVDGLSVVRVQEGSVVLRGPDTTVVLRVQRPGQGDGNP